MQTDKRVVLLVLKYSIIELNFISITKYWYSFNLLQFLAVIHLTLMNQRYYLIICLNVEFGRIFRIAIVQIWVQKYRVLREYERRR